MFFCTTYLGVQFFTSTVPGVPCMYNYTTHYFWMFRGPFYLHLPHTSCRPSIFTFTCTRNLRLNFGIVNWGFKPRVRVAAAELIAHSTQQKL